MSRYIRSQLKRLWERVEPHEAPEDSVPRADVVEYLDRIAEAKRGGDWTEKDAAELRELVRTETERRRGEGYKL